VLLQVLDDGRLTDGQGRVVDFTNTVIIMTSNLGSDILLREVKPDGTLPQEAKEGVMAVVKKHFRPEFLNRLDDLVVFAPLTFKDLGSIIKLQIQSLQSRLEGKDVTLDLHDSAVEYVLKNGYDPVFGARPLKRFLEKNIVTQLSRMIISGDLKDHSIVHIEVGKGQLQFFTEEKEDFYPKKRTKTQ
jgi:ATP-dependent Clp protease ATP-binding subunit ClpB